MTNALEDRTLLFSKRIISFCNKLARHTSNKIISTQLLRSATSVGANYREATGAVSRTDFRNKIHTCKKEAQETYYWLELLEEQAAEDPEYKLIKQESHELVLIFGKIGSTMKKARSKFEN